MTDVRRVLDGIQFILASGCQWRLLLGCFPSRFTVQSYFFAWSCSDLLGGMMDALQTVCQARSGRLEGPTAAIIDSQTVKVTESGGSRDCDAGKKVYDRNLHLVFEVEGSPFLLGCITPTSRTGTGLSWPPRAHISSCGTNVALPG